MKCPIPNCNHAISERKIVDVVGLEKLNRFQRLSVEQVASQESTMSFCPFPDCGFIFSLNHDEKSALSVDFDQACGRVSTHNQNGSNILEMAASAVPTDASSALVNIEAIEEVHRRAKRSCPKCSGTFCLICLHDWASCECSRIKQKIGVENWKRQQLQTHERNDEEVRGQQKWRGLQAIFYHQQPLGANADSKDECKIEDDLNFRKCRRCGIYIEKKDGCDKMKCRCGYRFCFICGSENAQCNCTPASHGFWDNDTNRGDFQNLREKVSPT